MPGPAAQLGRVQALPKSGSRLGFSVSLGYTLVEKSNKLLNAGPRTFTYTPDGAVRRIDQPEETQELVYGDARFMRLPTQMVRSTKDGRLVQSDLAYDMSGTRVYKRDYVRQASAGANATDARALVSDRETYYLANGTEVLMEVENRGPAYPDRETGTFNKAASTRYSAYIFGAGSRLARLSWDEDGQGLLVPLLNGGFENGLEGWQASSNTVAKVIDDPAQGRVAKVIRGHAGEDYLEESLGQFKAGDRIDASVLARSDEGVTPAQMNLVLIRAADGGLETQPGTAVGATNWVPLNAAWSLPAAGELRVRLAATGTTQGTAALFDTVTVRCRPSASTLTNLPNLWADPGFENALVSNQAGVTVVDADPTGSKVREGLHLLKVAANANYVRTINGLDPTKNYLFSVWSMPEGGTWVRTNPIQRSPAAAGRVSWTLVLNPGVDTYYDQAEVVEDPGGITIPESWIPENRMGRVDWFVTDHLGSTKLLIDQNGQHRFTGDDDPFGINLRSFGDKDTHRYTGQILDEEQGLYYYGARYYLPEIGRFLSGDPAKQFHNIYNYAGNAPTALVDPDGKNGVNQLRNSNGTINVDIPVVWTSRSISVAEARNALQSNYNNMGNGWEYERSKAGLFAGKIKYAVNVNVDMVDASNKKEVARLVSTYGASSVNYISTAANYNEMKGMKSGYGFAFDGKLEDSEANQYHNRAVVSLFSGSPDVLNVLCHEVSHLLGFPDINSSTAIGNKDALKFRINWNEPGSKDRRVTQDDINVFLDKTLPAGIDKMGDTSIPFSFPSN